MLGQKILLTTSNLKIAYLEQLAQWKKKSDKEKYVNSRYGITVESAGSWHFNSDTARNIIIFGVDNSSSSHSDNRKNNF